MRSIADKRRYLSPLMAGLLLLAVIGPVCVLRASQAYAMTMSARGDCDGGTAGSMSTCPHQNPQRSTPAPQTSLAAPDVVVTLAAALLPPDPSPAPVTDGHAAVPAPGPLIAPLRI